TFDCGFLRVSCAKAGLRMYSGNPHEVDVSTELRSGVDHRCTDVHHRMPEQSAPEHHDLDGGMSCELHRDVRAVRHQSRSQVWSQVTRNLYGRGATIQDHDLTGTDHRGTGLAEDHLFSDGHSFADPQVAIRQGCGQRTAVHAL